MAKAYPHVDAVSDWPTKQTVRLLWDEIHALREQLTTTQADLRTATVTLADHDTRIVAVQRLAAEASLAVGQPVTSTGSTPLVPVPPGGVGPSIAPNMYDTLVAVKATQAWVFNGGDAYDQTNPLGRGAFTEAAVAAMHAIDPLWGHIQKFPGQNQYNGHAVDACMYKRADLTAGEIFDIVSLDIQWVCVSISLANLTLWYF